MNLSHLTDLLEQHEGAVGFLGSCHDCGKPVRVDATAMEDGIHIDGGSVYAPFPDEYMVKCEDCFVKDPVLRNYQDCEVYARVVGYYRPVGQFNDAKVCEFHDRVNFKI